VVSLTNQTITFAKKQPSKEEIPENTFIAVSDKHEDGKTPLFEEVERSTIRCLDVTRILPN